MSCRLWSSHGPKAQGLGDWGRHRAATPSIEYFDVGDRAWLAFDLATGCHVTCAVSWTVHGMDENRIRIVGEHGGVDYWPGNYGTLTPTRVLGTGLSQAEALGQAMPDQREDLDVAWFRVAEQVASDVATQSHHLVGGADALVVAELIDRAYGAAPPM